MDRAAGGRRQPRPFGRIGRRPGARDPRFSLIEFSRNFGFQAALAAGLAHAPGDAVVTMDADLQDPPECIPEMVAKWRAAPRVVRAVRRTRQETGSRRLGMDVFHGLFNRISDYRSRPTPAPSA